MTYFPTGTELLNPFKILERAGLSQGMSLADLGCGSSGHFVFAASKIVGEDGKIYAVDILKSVLEAIDSKAKLQGFTNVQTIWADIEKIGAVKVPAESLDTALLVNVHAKEEMIAEAKRLLKPGGSLVIVDWSTKASPLGPEKRVNPAEAKGRGNKLNLNLKEEFEAGPYHWGLIFQKP